MHAEVLVTGATGFVAGHCIADLLEHGYRVRGTVRDFAAVNSHDHLLRLLNQYGGLLELVQADLTHGDGWHEAAAGCDYVMHIASPFPSAAVQDDNEILRPAIEGTLRVLRACADSVTVRRVVLTSSTAAIVTRADRRDQRVRTEDDWSVLDGSPVYHKSKTLAERIAWDYVRDLPAETRFELVALCPGTVLGPVQRPAVATSVEIVRQLLAHELPGSPRIGFSIVDVRDLAIAHRLALETRAAAGNRYICAGPHLWMHDIARILAAEFGPSGYQVPTRTLPNWLTRTIKHIDQTARLMPYLLDRCEPVAADKAENDLSWTMRPLRDTILDCARSLLDYSLVKSPISRQRDSETEVA